MHLVTILIAIVVFANTFRSIKTKVELIDNGYEGIYVVIKDTVKEDATLIDRIKVILYIFDIVNSS